MKREIKFEYGFESVNGTVKKVYHLHEIPFIREKCDVWDMLPLKYTRQFTGFLDKNGREIFAGDIYKNDLFPKTYVISFWSSEKYGACFCVESHNSIVPLNEVWARSGAIIGSMHDNPELLNPPIA